MKAQKPLGIKILEREIKKGASIVKKEIKKNPKILESNIIMYIPGLIACRALLKLFSEMGKEVKK